jgi:regulator of protease activity HflC (stomatin/prohibitin superfamily)
MTYTLIAVAGVAFVLVLVLRGQVISTTIFEYERGLRFSRGKFHGELGPGLYRYLKTYTAIRKLDVRPVQLPVNGQEVLTRDGVAVKISLSATYQVLDARKAVFSAENHVTALYTELQQALRAVVSATDAETLLASRADLGARLLEVCKSHAVTLGLELQALAVRDLTFPGELKKIFAQVVKARQEGLAALERARGETAALRNLANAAQMVQRNPHLFQLRLLQVAGQQAGTTLVVGMPQGVATVPLKQGAAELEALPPEQQDGEAGA